MTTVHTAEAVDVGSRLGGRTALVGLEILGKQHLRPGGQAILRKPHPAVLPDIGGILVQEVLQRLQTNGGKIAPGAAFDNIFEVGGRTYGGWQIDIFVVAFNGYLQFEFHADTAVFAGKWHALRRCQGGEEMLQIVLVIVERLGVLDMSIHEGKGSRRI